MYYELYADSLWLLNFVMNLYLLILVDRSLMRTATRVRLVLGAAAGAVGYLLPFFWGAPVWLKYPAGIAMGTAAMIFTVFRPGSSRAFIKILEKLILYSFLTGGMMLFLLKTIPFLREKMLSICGILGIGAVGFLAVTYLQDRGREARKNSACKAILSRNGSKISVTALIDSGNSLREPISGQPVSIIDEKIFCGLWQKDDLPFRAIPYHTIGKKRGILRGYLLPELKVEVDGMVKSFQDVYVAVSEEYTGEVRMILNPALLDDKVEKENVKNKNWK